MGRSDCICGTGERGICRAWDGDVQARAIVVDCVMLVPGEVIEVGRYTHPDSTSRISCSVFAHAPESSPPAAWCRGEHVVAVD